MSSKDTRRAYNLLRNLPRICLNNIKLPKSRCHIKNRAHGKYGGKTHGRGKQGSNKHGTTPPLGFLASRKLLLQTTYPLQDFYKNHHSQLGYFPLGLQQLQLMIDTQRVNVDEPIDITQIFRSGVFFLKPTFVSSGFYLKDDGMEHFVTPINLEVQWASEAAISAVERVGGTVTTAYYDPLSVRACSDPKAFFESGNPIPKRLFPPQDLIAYYSDPKNRGYLADPDEIARERFLLSQKMGYELPNIKESLKYDLLVRRKELRQLFYGLQPGWIINLMQKQILKPQDEELLKYYNS